MGHVFRRYRRGWRGQLDNRSHRTAILGCQEEVCSLCVVESSLKEQSSCGVCAVVRDGGVSGACWVWAGSVHPWWQGSNRRLVGYFRARPANQSQRASFSPSQECQDVFLCSTPHYWHCTICFWIIDVNSIGLRFDGAMCLSKRHIH